ncbi:cytochrome C oxidase subunit IV family protein [Shimia biformata]|uniref:cytochrome C oxidase subunit IV family protein n=1 Tax=Shimia biformata TaxID=1294299 RepID=UPI00194E7291|nr:cytochrome C oxidase subunit IV family protein [Shimia biformata]
MNEPVKNPDPLRRAWLTLLALSGASALVAELAGQGVDRRLIGTAILVLALMKSRVILARYLDLAAAPSWLRGFTLTLWIFGGLLLGLFLVAGA